METIQLFIERFDQIRELTASQKHIALLELAARLRQMFLDKASLVHLANREEKQKLIFLVGDFTPGVFDKYVSFLSLEDGLDPDTSVRGDIEGGFSRRFPRPQGDPNAKESTFGSRHYRLRGQLAGGVHVSSPKGTQVALDELGKLFTIGGYPAGLRTLQAIARVSLKGLTPLYDALTRKRS